MLWASLRRAAVGRLRSAAGAGNAISKSCPQAARSFSIADRARYALRDLQICRPACRVAVLLEHLFKPIKNGEGFFPMTYRLFTLAT
jgi:hypothetical protein